MEEKSKPDVAEDLSPFFLIHHNGRVERLKGADPPLPPSLDAATGVSSKDVTIDSPQAKIPARIFLPPLSSGEKLPILVYFHGGAFCIESAFSPRYHSYLISLSSRTRALCVSVDYRLAPEHPLPAAYEDSYAALSWVLSKADSWILDHGNLDRVFLGGDSAGANIAHNVAIRAENYIEGVMIVHPYFLFKDGRENPLMTKWNEKFFRVIYPSSPDGSRDVCMNPSLEKMKEMRSERVLVCIAAEDFLREQGECYVEALKESGYSGRVEVLVSGGEGHVFHLHDPGTLRAEELMGRLVQFMNERW